MKIFKKRNWVFYLVEFLILGVAYFLANWFIDGLELRRCLIGGVVGGIILTTLNWFMDQATGQIKKDPDEE